MSRLFKKRANSRTDSSEAETTPVDLHPDSVMNESILKKRAVTKGITTNAGGADKRRVSDRAPSLNVDIRNSLMLPGLSQRFSVLLPTIASAPESSIRSLLASQRGRDGPSLTIEEEELLFAEMRDDSPHEPHWNTASTSTLTSSASSPSLFSETDNNGPQSPPLDSPNPWPASPPPTSASFSSFRTFGVADPAIPETKVKVKSYGFGGNSTLRDEVYIRKAKKSAESAGKGEALGVAGKPPATSAIVESPDPFTTTPSPTVSPSTVRNTPKRQSKFAQLTPAQVKRISLALGEIEGKLSRPPQRANESPEDDKEETLRSIQRITPTRTHARLPSDSRSEVSSEISSAFPYKESPIGSHFSEGPSPSRLPPSPRTHNLAAQVTQPQPIPFFLPGASARPIMTPSRTQPMRHQASSSITSVVGSPVPMYIPGQPRPVGSAHRSEGSVSSPADTSFSPRAASPIRSGHASVKVRSDALEESSPPVLPPRSTSLGRSQSVSQNAERSRPPTGSAHLRAQSVDTAITRGPSSTPRPSSPIEEEAEEDASVDSHLPQVQIVPGRCNMADNRSLPGSNTASGLGVRATGLNSRVVSQQGSIVNPVPGRESSPRTPHSPTLRRPHSSQSVGSMFTAASCEFAWDRLFETDEGPGAVEDENLARDILRKLSGLDAEELSIMQEKLVMKAKLERMALRGNTDFTPEIASSPELRSISQPSLPARPSRVMVTNSPPLVESQIPAASPAAAGPDILPAENRSLVPAETPIDEFVATPSTKVKSQGMRRVIPAEDAAVRRDFEARIAAATAALNRTPSISAGLTRKNTKKGALVISSPTLVSTSAILNGDPLPPPVNPDVAKALEKASGSGSKMSARWRKLGFRRGPSVSNTTEIHSLPTTAKTAQLADPINLRALSPTPPTPVSAPSNMVPSFTSTNAQSPDLDAFRFPSTGHPVARSHSMTVSPSTGERHVRGVPQGGGIGDGTPVNSDVKADAIRIKPTASERPPFHSPSSSTDSAVIKFIAAGRAVGLDDAQLNDMLIAKGMLKRSASSASSTEPASTAPTGSTVQTPRQSPASTHMSRMPSAGASAEKKSGGAKGLFRSLSRKKSKTSTESPVPAPAPEPPIPRSEIVRRTILLPQEDSLAPPSEQHRSPAASPGKASPSQRKLSIKRKPVQLSHEDHALVQQSPRSNGRKTSVTSVQSGTSTSAHAPAANDLLQPSQSQAGAANSGASDRDSMTRSSTGGSFYDLYGGDEEVSETLTSPVEEEEERTHRLEAGDRTTQAVEITEYADGKVVWSLVDALRDPDDTESDAIHFGTPGNMNANPHSRSTSHSSRPDSKRDSLGDVFASDKGLTGLVSNTNGLKFRHRARADAAPRPPTNIYYTSSRDIGDLIDHLSSDLNASRGRIDILPLERSRTLRTSPESAGQFEDAPSPSNQPLPRPVHARHDLLPRRQLFPAHSDEAQVREGHVHRADYSGNGISPSAFSFASSGSGMPGEAPRSVEDRLQALLDRLKESGVKA